MSEQTVRGAAQTVVGSVNDAAGRTGGNGQLPAEGKADKNTGGGIAAVNEAKDAAYRATR